MRERERERKRETRETIEKMNTERGEREIYGKEEIKQSKGEKGRK